MASNQKVASPTVPDLPIHELLALEAVSRLGSVQRAAEALHVTPSGISHRIAALQRRIGATLLLRKGRGVSLSEIALDYVGTIREGLTNLSLSTQSLREAEHRLIRITTAAAIGASWLLPLLKQFSEQRSEATFEITTTATPDELPSDRWDIMIHYGVPRTNGSRRRALRTDQLITVCAPSLLKGRSRSLTAQQRSTLPTLRLLQLDNPVRRAAGGPTAMSGSAQLVFDDAVGMLEAAASGAGVAVTTETAARPYLVDGRLAKASPEVFPGEKYFIDLSEAGRFKPSALSLFQWLGGQRPQP
jgi:LysR family transcriptional regulator, glycine cleavage system transcriptional activator